MKRIEESGEISFKQAFVDFWRGLFSFGGRSTRTGYWYGIMTASVISYGILGLLIALNGMVRKIVGPSGAFMTLFIISVLVYLVVSIIIQIGTWALFFRRMRDVGFKTTPLIIWLVISLAPIPLLAIVMVIANIWLLYVASVPSGHFVKQYQNGFMKFLFESPETFEFHDDLQVIEFEPDGTEETVVKGRIMERGKVSFKQAFHDYFHGMLSFGGRSTRAGFWKVAPIIQIIMMIFWIGFMCCIIFFLMNIGQFAFNSTEIMPFSTNIVAIGVGMIILSAFVPFGFANWAVMIRRLRDVGLKLKTMFIGWGLMAVLNIIILIVFSAGYGFTLGIIWGTIWNIGIDLIIQIIFLCLPTGAMATQKEDSKFFENKALY